jgi:hypothetical protein
MGFVVFIVAWTGFFIITEVSAIPFPENGRAAGYALCQVATDCQIVN